MVVGVRTRGRGSSRRVGKVDTVVAVAVGHEEVSEGVVVAVVEEAAK